LQLPALRKLGTGAAARAGQGWPGRPGSPHSLRQISEQTLFLGSVMFSDLPQVLDKPPLYHYTKADSIMNILTSGSLHARPTWDFQDTDEYVHGLKLIESHLKRLRASGREFDSMPPATQAFIRTHGMDSGRIVDQTLEHIAYEIQNFRKPAFEVYVACTSVHPASAPMARRYGGFVLNFNWALYLLAYACPSNFAISALSRATYDERVFEQFLMCEGFTFGGRVASAQVGKMLAPLDVRSREATTAATAAIFLCMVAPNIKKPEFAYEGEWRLKLARVNHSIPTIFSVPDGSLDLRHALGMTESAELTTNPPGRYPIDLRLWGRMAIERVTAFFPADVLATTDVAVLASVMRETDAYVQRPDLVMGRALDLRDALLRGEAPGLWTPPVSGRP
jgi:hypothetical protein